jgi:hypothetical protein
MCFADSWKGILTTLFLSVYLGQRGDLLALAEIITEMGLHMGLDFFKLDTCQTLLCPNGHFGDTLNMIAKSLVLDSTICFTAKTCQSCTRRTIYTVPNEPRPIMLEPRTKATKGELLRLSFV